MSASPAASGPAVAGLRERKKARTRAEIRAHALRLFREQGYRETTTEQIAAAAGISPATFFRYFITKERTVLSDDLAPVLLAALAEQPADLPPLTALHRAISSGLALLETQEQQERRELITTIAELRAAQRDDLARTVKLLGEAAVQRLGRSPVDFENRVFIGALTGAVLAALGDDPQDPARADSALRAIGYLETGFPFAGQRPAGQPADSPGTAR